MTVNSIKLNGSTDMYPTCGPVHILLGTYNGARYVAEQIHSIQRQKVEHWRMLIRDDGSTDETLDILKRIARQDKRIRLLEDRNQNLGVIGNFGKLMIAASEEGAEVIFFSDQDDLWLSDKLGIHLHHMNNLQLKFGKDIPLLVHSDLIVVNEGIDILGESFMAYQGIFNEYDSPLNTLLVQNFVTGCATSINGSLLKLALPVPENIVMHDWWVALCAAALGKIGYIQSPTVLYRQHGANSVGAKYFLDMFNPLKTKPIIRWKTGKHHFLGSILQAKSLLNRIENHSDKRAEDAARLIKAYLDALSMKTIRRILKTIRLGCRRQGIMRQTLFLSRLALTKPH